MRKLVLETTYSLREALLSIKDRLVDIDERNNKVRENYKIHNYSLDSLKVSMEEDRWNDKLFLVYRNDYYNDEFYIFDSQYDIEEWLKEKWSDWDLWECNMESFLEEDLVVWEFRRNICKVKWENLYEDSKPVIEGWLRIRESIEFNMEPSFSFF